MPVFRFFRSRDPRCWRCCLFATPCVNDETRFNGSIYESATYAPRAEEILAKAEINFNRDASAADRVREVFGQFIPNEARRGNRYSSRGTIIRYLRAAVFQGAGAAPAKKPPLVETATARGPMCRTCL